MWEAHGNAVNAVIHTEIVIRSHDRNTKISYIDITQYLLLNSQPNITEILNS